jgi:hypothetical protein
MGKKQRRETAAALAAVPEDESRVILAGSYIGEGFDDERLGTLPGDADLLEGDARTRDLRRDRFEFWPYQIIDLPLLHEATSANVRYGMA